MEAVWWEGGGTVWPPSLEGSLAPGVRYDVAAHPLDTEILLLEGTGRAPGAPAVPAARVYWRADPERRAAALGGAAEVGGTVTVEDGGRIRGHQGSCALADTTPPLVSVIPLEDDLPPDPGGEPDSLPPLGLLGGPALRERAGVGSGVHLHPSGSGPQPDPSPPGPGSHPAVHLADGLLQVGAGDTLRGLFLVAGDLLLEAEAALVGAARVRGDVRIASGAELVGDRCAVLEALRLATSLSIPLPVPGGSWLPVP